MVCKTYDGPRGALSQALELNKINPQSEVAEGGFRKNQAKKIRVSVLPTKGADGLQILEVIAHCAALTQAKGVN